MLEKRAQGLSITTIVVAILALIVIVVIIAMLTGKLGMFGAGAEEAASCENACKAIGRDYDDGLPETNCKDQSGIIPFGTYNEIQSGWVCCCKLPPKLSTADTPPPTEESGDSGEQS